MHALWKEIMKPEVIRYYIEDFFYGITSSFYRGDPGAYLIASGLLLLLVSTAVFHILMRKYRARTRNEYFSYCYRCFTEKDYGYVPPKVSLDRDLDRKELRRFASKFLMKQMKEKGTESDEKKKLNESFMKLWSIRKDNLDEIVDEYFIYPQPVFGAIRNSNIPLLERLLQ